MRSDLKGCLCCPRDTQNSMACDVSHASSAWDGRGMSSRLDTFTVAVQNSTHYTAWTLVAVCVYWRRPITLTSALWSRTKVPVNVDTRRCGNGVVVKGTLDACLLSAVIFLNQLINLLSSTLGPKTCQNIGQNQRFHFCMFQHNSRSFPKLGFCLHMVNTQQK